MDSDQQNQNIVDEHRKMVVMTGALSDFQLENLQKWPFVVFGDILTKVEVGYDFVSGDEEKGQLNAGSVTYDFYFKEDPIENVSEVAQSMLTLWTKYLFWSDTEVNFKKEGKKWKKAKAKNK